jgi:hypothetical protein
MGTAASRLSPPPFGFNPAPAVLTSPNSAGRFESLVYNPYNVEFARERNQCLPVTFPQVKL